MADAMETLKGLLGDDAEDKIRSAMGALSGGGAISPADSGGDLAELRSLIDRLSSSRSDPRANLLMSLRPYMREGRQRSIDSAVKLLNLSKLSALFKGGI